jgi:uncharacterized membrane protein
MFIAVTVLPCHFALTASGFARAFVVEVESVPLRDFAEDAADKYFQSISDTLSPFMSE